jgi:hypothetical protein
MKKLLLLAFLFYAAPSFATHLLNGSINYKYIGNDNYEITIILYRDAIHGAIGAIQGDEETPFLIFDNNFNILSQEVVGTGTSVQTYGYQFITCGDTTSSAINQFTFKKTYHLPKSSGGYHLVAEHCCRSGEFINLSSSGGLTLKLYNHIPDSSFTPNNSAVFNDSIEYFVCKHDIITIDASAKDLDGDSLSYELTYPLGTRSQTPSGYTPTPLLDSIHFASGYSLAHPLSDSGFIEINNQTGILRCSPSHYGSYLTTILCKEWKNGVNINWERKDIVINGRPFPPVDSTFFFSITPLYNPWTYKLSSFDYLLKNPDGSPYIFIFDFMGRFVTKLPLIEGYKTYGAVVQNPITNQFVNIYDQYMPQLYTGIYFLVYQDNSHRVTQKMYISN